LASFQLGKEGTCSMKMMNATALMKPARSERERRISRKPKRITPRENKKMPACGKPRPQAAG